MFPVNKKVLYCLVKMKSSQLSVRKPPPQIRQPFSKIRRWQRINRIHPRTNRIKYQSPFFCATFGVSFVLPHFSDLCFYSTIRIQQFQWRKGDTVKSNTKQKIKAWNEFHAFHVGIDLFYRAVAS